MTLQRGGRGGTTKPQYRRQRAGRQAISQLPDKCYFGKSGDGRIITIRVRDLGDFGAGLAIVFLENEERS